MEPWEFLQEKPLENIITMGYASVFTASVLKASSKLNLKRLGKTQLSILSRETSR